MWSKTPYTFDRVVRIVFTMIVVCIVLYILYYLRAILLPFFAACLIAYIIEPFVRWNQKKLKIKKHVWAVIVTVAEALIFFGIFCLILIPIIEKECAQLSVILSHYLKVDDPSLGRIPATIHHFFHSHMDVDKIIAELEKMKISAISDSIWRALTTGLDKILGVLGWLICVVYVIFILLDFDKYKNGIMNLIPDKYMPAINEIHSDVSWTMQRYFRNQALISFFVGICYAIGFSIVGIPMGVVIGLINMFLFMVPYLVYVSVIPVTLMCIFKSMATGTDFWIIWMECVAVYVFVESFSDLFLTPKIMGKALGLNPAIIVLALSVWGSLLGLLGMIIALPLSTILIKWGKMMLLKWKNEVNSSHPVLPQEPPDTSEIPDTLDTSDTSE